MDSSIIRVTDLRKSFETVQPRGKGIRNLVADFVRPQSKAVEALAGISFSVQPGECVGYLGPNGAGKSTTIKCLTGVLQPTSGTAEVMGWVPWQHRQSYTRHIGVVFGQKPLLLWDLPVYDTLRLYQAVYEVDDTTFRARVSNFHDVLGIGPLLNRPARKLSLGERMRCELAVALIHNPPVLFLDEPTVGLDVVAKENLRKFLRQQLDVERTTIILTTHQMDDVEALCNRIIIINRGQLLFDGGLERFRQQHTQSRRVHVQFGQVHNETRLGACLQAAIAVDRSGDRLSVEVDSGEIAHMVAEISAAVETRDIRIEEPRLESLIATWF